MRRALTLMALAMLAACNGPAEDTAPNAVAANNMASLPDNAAAINVAAPATEDAPLDRFGPIRIGATIADLASEGLKVASRDEPMPGSTCSYARFEGLPDVAAMLDGEKIVRIDISGKQHEGPHGLRIGQSEADALARLGSAKVDLHPYTGPEGHYLILHKDGAPYGLIAETDGKSVLRWRIGQWEQVQWVESCF